MGGETVEIASKVWLTRLQMPDQSENERFVPGDFQNPGVVFHYRARLDNDGADDPKWFGEFLVLVR